MGWWNDLWGDNSQAYGKYENELQGLAKGYDPYTQAGQKTLADLLKQGNMMTNSPWQLEDELQSHYNQSPGFQYAQNQITQRMNNNAALSGMGGTGAENASLQKALTGNLEQNMDQYVDRGINTYNQGLNTEGNINQMGYNALGQKNQLMQGGYQAGLQGDISHANAIQHMAGAAVHGAMDLFDPGASMGQAFGDLGEKMGLNSVGGQVGYGNYGGYGGYGESQGMPNFNGYAYGNYMPGASYSNWWEGL